MKLKKNLENESVILSIESTGTHDYTAKYYANSTLHGFYQAALGNVFNEMVDTFIGFLQEEDETPNQDRDYRLEAEQQASDELWMDKWNPKSPKIARCGLIEIPIEHLGNFIKIYTDKTQPLPTWVSTYMDLK